MASLQPDSQPLYRGNVQANQEQSSALKVGIFHADVDTLIASRIAGKFNQKGCSAKLFDFHDAGLPKMELIESFISSNNMILWIATRTALNDKGIIQAARHMAHYASVDRKDLGIRYVTFQPHEHLSERLPLALDAYTTLREDNHLSQRLDATIKSVRKSRLNLQRDATQDQHTASPNAVGGLAAELNQLPPNSDNSQGMMSAMNVVRGDGNVQAKAVPFGPPYGRTTVEASDAQQTTPAGSQITVQADVVNVVHIHNSDVSIGSSSTVADNAPPSSADGSWNNDNSDGTPV